jgi:hypothetical protein
MVFVSTDTRGDGLVYPSRVSNVVPTVPSSYHSVEATVTVVPQAEAPLRYAFDGRMDYRFARLDS